MKHIPNFITSLNLAAGFVAIIFAGNGDLVTASWLILAAMVFDFLDGFAARSLKAYSDVGKELDSLADVVSFGVAPALIIYHLLKNSIAIAQPMVVNSNGLLASIIVFIPVIMPVAGAIRLAIFNLDTTQTKTFRGLPTPANALAVISVIIAGQNTQSELFHSFTGSPLLLIIFTVILSLLMVSRIPLLSLKVSNLKFRGNEGRYILILLVIGAFAVFGTFAFPLIIPLYIVASALSLMF